MAEYPEHLNGDIPILIAQFERIAKECNDEVMRYANKPTEIDLPSSLIDMYHEPNSDETITPNNSARA